MVNQREPRSIFILLRSHAQHYGFLYEIDLVKLKGDKYTQPLLEPVLEFFDKKWGIPRSSLFHCARLGSKVYLLCSEIIYPYRSPLRPTDAFYFDINDLDSNLLQQFPPPKSPKIWSVVLSAYGKLYHLAQPSCFPYIEKDSFECYDPTDDSWESLPPYPHYSFPNIQTHISGYAVLYGYILFSILDDRGALMIMMAFHIATKTWHEVRISESMKKVIDGFSGRAVVVDNMIYALTSTPNELFVFSFCWDSSDVITKRSHYIGPLFSLYILDQAPLPACSFDSMVTQSLIHLGQRDFCLVQTGFDRCFPPEHQYIIVTSFRVLGEGQDMCIQILHSRTFQVAIDDDRDDFFIEFGFTTECKDIEPEGASQQNVRILKEKEKEKEKARAKEMAKVFLEKWETCSISFD